MRRDQEGSRNATPSPSGTANGPSSPNKTRQSNGSANSKAAGNGIISHTNGDTPSHLRFSHPTFYGHDREELTRILIQGLQDLGYDSSAGMLSRESGYDLETPYASAFRIAIVQGEWAEAEALLSETYAQTENGGGVSIDMEQDAASDSRTREARQSQKGNNRLYLSEEADRTEMLFLIRKQKYLELLEERDLAAALLVLRQELHPLNQDESELHALSGYIMCQSAEDLKAQANWDGANGESRKLLLSQLSLFISPSIMIPEHRLATLFTQTKTYQVQHCLYHNSPHPPSLYTNHSCDRQNFPLETITELDRHKDEVWFVQFSNDGTRLATASKDKTVIIYDTTSFRIIYKLAEHLDSIVYVAWSPDDLRLISCSMDRTAKIWEMTTGTCIRTIGSYTEPVTSAAWSMDGEAFVVGSHDQSRPLAIWSSDLSDTYPLHIFDEVQLRIGDCALGPSKRLSATSSSTNPTSTPSNDVDDQTPTRIVAIDTDSRLHVYDYQRRHRLHQVNIGMNITCVNLSCDAQEMLLNLSNGEVWTMGVDDCEVKQKFRGGKQQDFVIRSCFGGPAETCIISGGEDSKINIWHRLTGRLLEQLDGHRSGCVNSVAWNTANPTMFASAGDDKKVRIWHKPLPPTLLQSLRETSGQPALPSTANTTAVNNHRSQTSITRSTELGVNAAMDAERRYEEVMAEAMDTGGTDGSGAARGGPPMWGDAGFRGR